MRIALIGFGNLGRAFAAGLLKSGFCEKKDITVCAKTEDTLKTAREQYGFDAVKDAGQAAKRAEVVVFSVKGNVFVEIAGDFNKVSLKNKSIISFMAGVGKDKIREALCFSGEIVRAMPSLAISDANGIIGYTKNENREIETLFKRLGFSFTVAESDIEKITAFSACGLGFAAFVIESFVLAGRALGLDEELCEKIARRSFENAAQVKDLQETIASVATKGGATERGLLYMTENSMQETIKEAFGKAYDKARG